MSSPTTSTLTITQPTEQRLVGRRRLIPRWRVRPDGVVHRRRWPLTKKRIIHLDGRFNPKSLRREMVVSDKRPMWWVIALGVIAIGPTTLGSGRLLAVGTTFLIYSAINLMWILVVGTAGILSLASLAVVGAAAYTSAWLSISHGFPWPVMLVVGGGVGLVFGAIIAIPARRMDGMYYALLTLGLVELCRVYVIQSKTFGSATGGLYGADSFVPAAMRSTLAGFRVGYVAAFVLLLAALAVYRAVNGERLGMVLRVAREEEAVAESMGIGYESARLAVFLISSAGLGVIGGFYAAYNTGASPNLFTIDRLLLLFAMIVIGGSGRAEGAVLGTLIVTLINDWFVGWGPKRVVIIGVLMLLVTLFARAGLFGIRQQFIEFRQKKSSERRADRVQRKGIVVAEEAIDIQDKQDIAYRAFDRAQRDHLKNLITPQLVEEHRAKPMGQHSDDLERVLNYFRRTPVADKYAVYTVVPFAAYRIVSMSGVPGVPPRIVDDRVHASIDEALHAVFVRRVDDLMGS